MNTKTTIFIGSDHTGTLLKQYLIQKLSAKYNIIDLGVEIGVKTSDYPLIAQKVAINVVKNKNNFGIVICGTGQGVMIAANKINGIRCGYGNNLLNAQLIRAHNNANMIALGARIIANYYAYSIVNAFLTTKFLQNRHLRRVNQIKKIEIENDNQ